MARAAFRSSLVRMGKPFARGPFAELPDSPRIAHGYEATVGRELTMDSTPFGRMRVHYRELGRPPLPRDRP